ncbi:hypothetical protein [Streptomyces sp. NPDC003032]
MGRARPVLLLALALLLSALGVTAVHRVFDSPFVVRVLVDAVVGLCWLSAAPFLFLRALRQSDERPHEPRSPADLTENQAAVQFRTDSDAIARSRWRSKGRP